MDTIIKDTLSQHKIMLDENCKLMISHEEILSRIDQFGKEEPEGLVVVESALLVGAGYEKRFDQLWYIYTREEVRYERLRASRGYSDEKIAQMIAKQQSEEEFKSMASHIIDNSGDLEDTKAQIIKILG